jgi:hypothetical protein
MGHYIGEVALTEAGLDLLAAQEKFNSKSEEVVAEWRFRS